jgi:putative endonuclease
MPCVYILQFASEKFYVGSTVDLDRRIKQHTSGHTPSTKRLGKGILVLRQEYRTLKEARSVEYKLKKMKRSDYIAKIVEDGYIKIVP